MIRRVLLAAGLLLLVLLTADRARPIQAQSAVAPPAATHLASWPVTIRPNDLAASPDTGAFAVIDAGNSAIEILRPGGTRREFRRGFRDPRAAAFLPGGILLVGEAGSGSVKGYDAEGRVVLTLGNPRNEFIAPNDIAVSPIAGRIYVVDSAADMVKVYRSADGGPALQFGSSGSGPGQLSFPIAVAVDPAGSEAFVADARNRRIAVFDAQTGAFLRTFGSAGTGAGAISFPGGLCVDRDLRVYAVESLGGFVQIFDPYGGLVGQIGAHGQGDGQLRSPKAVVIDRYNRLLVTSFLDDKIGVWGLDTFENPVDQDLVALGGAIPAHLNPRLPGFRVVFQVPGIDPGAVDPATLRLNGAILPEPATYRLGPRQSIRFSTSEVLATLPRGFRGGTTLVLSGATRDGVRFEGDIAVVILSPVPGPDRRAGAMP